MSRLTRASVCAGVLLGAALLATFSMKSTPLAQAANLENQPAESFLGQLAPKTKVAFLGNSTAERMNLFGHLETLIHTKFADKQLIIRNFGWPAEAVDKHQRPDNYTKIDNPLDVFHPNVFVCFYGFNESYSGIDEANVDQFKQNYRYYIQQQIEQFGEKTKFVLVTPIAFEASGNRLHPEGTKENEQLKIYAEAVKELAEENKYPVVDLYDATQQAFAKQAGLQYTINGVHVNEAGDQLVSNLVFEALSGFKAAAVAQSKVYEQIREWVNDKSWYHLQDYRMLNGWYVYGGRRTWDTETFPKEYVKIRNMVSVRDQYIWDIAAGKTVADQPDDSKTGDLFTPQTMFGTRSDGFRKYREPEVLKYPTPEESIEMMTVPEGFRVELFASEREFPELANPNQLAFDSKGRLWVSCMVSYPQWKPGDPKPSDRLLIFEDTNNDGKADVCKTFYDKLICPTGFEFYNGGVLVVDEPRILFLKDTDGDDQADEVVQLIDGLATDDTHHTMGAWEWSHGGLLHMLEGIAMSTTIETPWGPLRNKGTGGSYVFDPQSNSLSHFRTPGYGNPWCLVFDRWGNGIIGDGTNAQQHWTSPLSGFEVSSRRTLSPVFNNEGMRPAVGNEFLYSRHFPDDVQGQFIYACVINMHGLPRFELEVQQEEAGYQGKRIANLLDSTDMIFRPVDPKIGPDGALWFGDWCNALIGHMQYSQRDPNRDHEHGRVYRLVYDKKPLLKKETLHDKSIPELLNELTSYELRYRYRVRTELRSRNEQQVLAAAKKWAASSNDPQVLCEAMWLQESFRALDLDLIDRILKSDQFLARSAAIHTVTNERIRVPNFLEYLTKAVDDPHPRVRLEAIRGLSHLPTEQSMALVLKVTDHPLDYWLNYTIEHTLHALKPYWDSARKSEEFLAKSSEAQKAYFNRYLKINGPGGAAVEPLEIAEDVDRPMKDRERAIQQLAKIRGGNPSRGAVVFERTCAACHQVGDLGKKFGPNLSDVGKRLNKLELIKSILWPNEKIAKGYETIMIVDIDGKVNNGFVINETEEAITLGIANGKTVTIAVDDILERADKKASSMPEGLLKQIAPIEALDLIAWLEKQKTAPPAEK